MAEQLFKKVNDKTSFPKPKNNSLKKQYNGIILLIINKNL